MTPGEAKQLRANATEDTEEPVIIPASFLNDLTLDGFPEDVSVTYARQMVINLTTRLCRILHGARLAQLAASVRFFSEESSCNR